MLFRILFLAFLFLAILSAAAFGQTISGEKTLSATATDTTAEPADSECGVDYVQFYLAGLPLGPQIKAPAAGNTFSFLWDTKTVADGDYVLTATATDKAGSGSICDGTRPNVGTSASILVKVFNHPPPADIVAPVITVAPPLAGAIITSKQQTIRVAAADASPIRNLSIKINGSVRASNTNQNALSMLWNTNPYKGTNVLIEASGTDSAGNVGTFSEVVTVRK